MISWATLLKGWPWEWGRAGQCQLRLRSHASEKWEHSETGGCFGKSRWWAVILCSQRPQPTSLRTIVGAWPEAEGWSWMLSLMYMSAEMWAILRICKDLSGPVPRYVRMSVGMYICIYICTGVLRYVRTCLPGYVVVWVYGSYGCRAGICGCLDVAVHAYACLQCIVSMYGSTCVIMRVIKHIFYKSISHVNIL